MKEYILENTMDRVSDKTLKFVKNDLTIEQMLEIITHTRNINLKNKKELLSKIKFSRYFNYCVRENLDILTAYLSCFDKKVVLETLLKTKKKFHIRDEEQKEKIDISIEDTKNLLEKTSYKSIYRIFNIPFSEDYIGDILEVWNDPEHYSQQINDIVIRGEYKKLGKFTNFHRIELAPEAAKILYKRRKIGFASVKKHLSKEELKNVVDRKKEIFKYIYKRLNRAMNPVEEEQGEKCTEKYDCTCSVCSRGRDYKNRYRRNIFNEHTYVNLIYRLIEKYEFDYKFIVETMGKLEDIQDPMFVASTLMENKFESRHGMAGRGAAMRSMMMSRMMGY